MLSKCVLSSICGDVSNFYPFKLKAFYMQDRQNEAIPIQTHPSDVGSLRQAASELQAADKKMAEGIKQLYETYHTGNLKYDAQGIATVILSAADLEKCKASFPNGLANGITLHFFEKGSTSYLPAQYLIQQKVESLCNAAAASSIDNKKANEIKLERNNIIQQQIATIFRDNTSTKAIHEAVEALMKDCSARALQKLHQAYIKEKEKENGNGNGNGKKTTLLDFESFSKRVIKQSSHAPSNSRDTLTFNKSTGLFSYNEAGTVTAHDRATDQGCANLGLVVEGRYVNKPNDPNKPNGPDKTSFRVTASYIKHASLAPIDALGNIYLFQREDNIDIIVSTCKHAKEVIAKMVQLRKLGQNENVKSMDINWVYQLLTSNCFNRDKQASTYGYMVQAMQLMDGGTFDVGPQSVTAHTSMIDAGINGAGGDDSHAYKQTTQRRENRKAYIRLTDSVSALTIDTNVFKELKASIFVIQRNKNKLTCTQKDIKTLQTLLIPRINENEQSNETATKAKEARATLQVIEQQSADNASTFITEFSQEKPKPNTERLKECITKANTLRDQARHQTFLIEKHQKALWEQNCHQKNEILSRIRTVFSYRCNIDIIQQKLAKNNETLDADATLRQLLNLSALIYKSYADDLYYSGDYRNPEKAALFHAYIASYQHAVGMIASIGCKSANDRTFVIRLLLAALEGRPIELEKKPEEKTEKKPEEKPEEKPEKKPEEKPIEKSELLPEACHLAEVFSQTQTATRLDKNLMSNTAVFSCINDTGGGTPKVSGTKFPLFKGLENIQFLSKFGHYASHKMEEMVAELKAGYQSFSSKIKTFFGRPIKLKERPTPDVTNDENPQQAPLPH